MSRDNLLIQLLGLVGTALFLLSVQCKKNKKLFRMQLVAYIFYTIHFVLLGALTGGVSYFINMLRSFCLSGDNRFLRSKTACAILCTMQITTLFVTWSGWITILPIAANIAATIGGYTYNGRKIRAATLFINSPLWMVYNIIVGSWAGLLDEIIAAVSIIISIIRFGWKNLDKVDT